MLQIQTKFEQQRSSVRATCQMQTKAPQQSTLVLAHHCHAITRSAPASIVGGVSSPSEAEITNLIGCSMASSADFARQEADQEPHRFEIVPVFLGLLSATPSAADYSSEATKVLHCSILAVSRPRLNQRVR